jgi:putative FmdB family regulatory protein
MPLYQYRCPHCGETKVELLSMDDRDSFDHVPRCGPSSLHPLAGTVPMRRMQTPVAGIVRNPAVPRSR